MAGGGRRRRQLWLLKSEPGCWSWQDQVNSDGGISPWDGVKNRQAINYMKSMRRGDRCFFYHSGPQRAVVGVVDVVRTWYEGGDGGCVDVKAVGELRRSVGLGEIKKMEKEEGGEWKEFKLLRQQRLSVLPVAEWVWDRICAMGEGFDGDGRDADDDEECVDKEEEGSAARSS